MTRNDGFDRTVSDWLDEQAGRGAPDYLDEILARTTRTRQRPAWSSLERWLPVQTTLRFAPVPRIAWLLVVDRSSWSPLGAAAVLIGSRTARAPAAVRAGRATARSCYGGEDGDIYALDPATGASTAVDHGRRPSDERHDFSPDGTRFVFLRARNPSPADGSRRSWSPNADGTERPAR